MSIKQNSRGTARLGQTGWTRTRAVLSVGMVLGLGAVGTMATWTDSATATSGTFSVTSMKMVVDGKTGGHQFAALNKQFTAVSQTFAGNVTVGNVGTQAFGWTVTSSVNDDPSFAGLSSNLWVKLFDGDASPNGASCGGAEITGARTLTAGQSDAVCVQVGLTAFGAANRFKIGTLGLDFVADGQ